MNLKEKFRNLIAQAREAAESGDTEKSVDLRKQAEAVKAQIDEEKALSDLEGSLPEPMRPAIPGTGAGAMTQGSVEKAVTDEDDENTPTYGAYVRRFGEGARDRTIKSVLKDLHGPDFLDAFWKQKASFVKYVRFGSERLNSDDHKNLRSVVLTPTDVSEALDQGVDSIKSIKTTMVEAADTLGGYMVPTDIQRKVIERIAGITLVRGRADQMSTSRDRVEMPRFMNNGDDPTDRYTSPVRVRWVDETPSQLAAQNVTFGMVSIPVHTSMVEAWLSRNLIEDTDFDIVGYLSKKLAEAAAIDEDDQFLFGDGIGKPKGILPGKANPASDDPYRLAEVDLKPSSGDDIVDSDKLLGVPYEIPQQYLSNASWFAARKTYLAIQQMKSTDMYMWDTFTYSGMNERPSGLRRAPLMGYDVLEQEGFPTMTGSGSSQITMLFGDLSAYQIVDRIGMTIERYIDSSTARNNTVNYIMRRRLGGQLLEPWRLVAVKRSA